MSRRQGGKFRPATARVLYRINVVCPEQLFHTCLCLETPAKNKRPQNAQIDGDARAGTDALRGCCSGNGMDALAVQCRTEVM